PISAVQPALLDDPRVAAPVTRTWTSEDAKENPEFLPLTWAHDRADWQRQKQSSRYGSGRALRRGIETSSPPQSRGRPRCLLALAQLCSSQAAGSRLGGDNGEQGSRATAAWSARRVRGAGSAGRQRAGGSEPGTCPAW